MALVDRIKCDADEIARGTGRPPDSILVWKFPSEELRLGAQLIVNQSQEAVFVKGGKALDVFGPGTHTLSTGNIPLLTKLVKLPFGGRTPFTAEVWYVNKTVKRDLTWGTRTPIQVIDPMYNYPVSIRSYGQWGIRIDDSRSFVNQVVGSMRSADSQKVEDYFIGEILQRLSDALAKYFVEKNLSAFQANAKLNDLSMMTAEAIRPEFARFGVEVVNFNVQNISIPKEEQQKFQEILGKRMEIDQISQARVGAAYTTMRTFDTLEKAAENQGSTGSLLSGGLGLGLGLSAGFPAGQQLAQSMSPAPPQPAASDLASKLQKLKGLLEAGLITQEDFDRKKQKLLEDL
jgi:membrane protease subunit (stomatin/prohibitin family)